MSDRKDIQPQPTRNRSKILGKVVFGLLLLLMIFVLGFRMGTVAPAQTARTGTKKELTNQTLEMDDFKELLDVYDSINEFYIEEVDKDQMIEGAIKGMVDALGDPHSEYLNAQESQGLDDSVAGSFEGVGIQISKENDRIIIISPIVNTPADRAGLQPQDIILEADGIDLFGMDTSEVVEHVRGPKGTEVTLKIQRGTSTFEVTLEREEIPLITVESEYLEEQQVGVIHISQFASTTYEELVKAIDQVKDQGAKKLVFDLRMNPGGLLDQALLVGNMFLAEGQTIMSVEDPEGVDEFIANNQTYGDYKIDLPFSLLVNEGSASASEIIAAIVQEETDGQLVGQTTFGKGTVQSILNETDRGELKLTIAKWLTPQGNWIEGEGVTPDLEVELDPLSEAILLNPDLTVEAGDTSDYVETIALLLAKLDYEITPRSFFDEDLTKAVQAFQKDYDFEPTGIIEGDSAQKINELAREYLDNHDLQLEAAIQALEE